MIRLDLERVVALKRLNFSLVTLTCLIVAAEEVLVSLVSGLKIHRIGLV